MSAWLTALRSASRSNGPTLGFHGVFNFWQVLSDEELITFSRTAPGGDCRGLGFGALCRNLVDLKRIEVARRWSPAVWRRFRAMCSGSTCVRGWMHCALLPSLSPPLNRSHQGARIALNDPALRQRQAQGNVTARLAPPAPVRRQW